MLRKILYILLQCTWGLPQTLMGLCAFIANRKYKHRMYRGCIETQWNLPGGLSLGMFIFTPPETQENWKLIRVHEYGHTIQSMVLGPWMLLVGIISVVWGALPYFERMRREKKLPYTACFVEAWASRWGEWVTGEKTLW